MTKERRSSSTGRRSPSTTLISGNAAAAPFDVNTFLKKTLSNFSVDKLSAYQQPHDVDDDDNTCSISPQLNNNIRSGDKGRCSVAKRICAYCGRRYSAASPTSSTTTADALYLYCDECYQLFTEHSRWEIQRRVKNMSNDEMKSPESSALLKTSATALEDEKSSGRRKRANFSRHNRPTSSETSHRRYGRSLSPERDVRGGERDLRGGGSFFGERNEKASAKVKSPSPSRRNSWSSSSSSRPTCRICHLPGDVGESLVTPCRCSGTMQYIHTTCLVHWLEISSKKVYPSPQCELCGYQFRTHHCYRLRRLHYPQCDHRDRVLHVVFLFMIIVMIGCAALSVIYLRADKGQRLRTSISPEDIVVIACSVLFFCAFFVAVFTQYRSDISVCRLMVRCWLINKHWRVKDYDRNLDFERVGKSPRYSDDV